MASHQPFVDESRSLFGPLPAEGVRRLRVFRDAVLRHILKEMGPHRYPPCPILAKPSQGRIPYFMRRSASADRARYLNDTCTEIGSRQRSLWTPEMT
jgi:hypothetical protein